MTIASTTVRTSFACDGTTKVFPVPIQSYNATDFTVILTAPTSAGGGQTTLTLNSDYSLAPSGTLQPTQWTLTTLAASAYAAGYTLQVIGTPVETQLTQYVQGQPFPSAAVQTNVDRLTQMVLRLSDQVSRAVRTPDGDVNPAMLLPNALGRASQAPLFDASGNLTLGAPTAQVLTSQQLSIFGTDSGVVNAYVVTHLGPVGLTQSVGAMARFVPLNTNTGAVTVNVDGTGAVAAVRANGSACTGGEFSSLGPVVIQWNGSAWQIVATAGAQPGYERQLNETNAGVVPTDYRFLPYRVRRYGADNTGLADCSTALANARLVYLQSAEMTFDTGTYKYATTPNWALNGGKLLNDGPVTLVYTGTAAVLTVDFGSGPVGYDMRVGDFVLNGGATATYGLYCKNQRGCFYGKLRVIGAATTGYGFYLITCVLNVLDNVTCSINEGLVSVPQYGVYITRIAPGQESSNNTIRDMCIEGPTTGLNGNAALFNSFLGGTCEDCGTGVQEDNLCSGNNFISMGFQNNITADWSTAARGSKLIGCYTNNLITVTGGAYCEVNGGQHQKIRIAAGVGGTSLRNVEYDRNLFLSNISAATLANPVVFTVNSGPIATLGAVTGGSGYTNGTYTGVFLTGGTGLNAVGTVVISGGAIQSVTLTSPGGNYVAGDVLSAALGGSGGSVPVATITHGLTNGDVVQLSGLPGSNNNSFGGVMNGTKMVATVISGTTFSVPVNSSAFPAYTSGGKADVNLQDAGTATVYDNVRNAGGVQCVNVLPTFVGIAAGSSSPSIFTNTAAYPVDVVVSGGTISQIAVGRAGSAQQLLPGTSAVVRLDRGDQIFVTWSVAPTNFYYIPRPMR